MRTRRLHTNSVGLPVRLVAVLMVTLAPSIVLWVRQSSDALFNVSSFPTAIILVAFWALPSLILCALLLKGPWNLGVGSVLSTLLLSSCWWVTAQDSQSTASWLPGSVGWIILPSLLFAVALASRLRSARIVDN